MGRERFVCTRLRRPAATARIAFVNRTILSAAVLACAALAGAGSPTARHMIYLHGRIVQETQSRRPHSVDFGDYDLDGILQALR